MREQIFQVCPSRKCQRKKEIRSLSFISFYIHIFFFGMRENLAKFGQTWGVTPQANLFLSSEIYLKAVVVRLIKCPSLQVSVWPHCHLIHQMRQIEVLQRYNVSLLKSPCLFVGLSLRWPVTF